MATVTVTLELSEEAAAELNRIALEEHCEPSAFLNGWLLAMSRSVHEEDFTPEQWEMIREGEQQADSGDFATPEQVEAIFKKYRRQ